MPSLPFGTRRSHRSSRRRGSRGTPPDHPQFRLDEFFLLGLQLSHLVPELRLYLVKRPRRLALRRFKVRSNLALQLLRRLRKCIQVLAMEMLKGPRRLALHRFQVLPNLVLQLLRRLRECIQVLAVELVQILAEHLLTVAGARFHFTNAMKQIDLAVGQLGFPRRAPLVPVAC